MCVLVSYAEQWFVKWEIRERCNSVAVHDGARNQIADQTIFCRIIIARAGNKRFP